MKLHVGLQNLGLCSAVITFKQEIFFYRATLAMFSIYTVSFKGLLRLHVSYIKPGFMGSKPDPRINIA